VPLIGIPVTTVPNPCALKTRWIGLRRGRHREEVLLELVHPLTGDRAQRQDRRIGEERALHDGAHVLDRELDERRLDHVDLRERNESARQSEQRHDRQVLARLRHDAVVGCDDEHDDVDARDHVLDEALVSRDVDDPDRATVGQLEAREAEVDRHPALLLLLEPVGIDAGQHFHERRLAVVDVPGGADDDGLDLHAGDDATRRERCRRNAGEDRSSPAQDPLQRRSRMASSRRFSPRFVGRFTRTHVVPRRAPCSFSIRRCTSVDALIGLACVANGTTALCSTRHERAARSFDDRPE
jgi:hypothetical protein